MKLKFLQAAVASLILSVCNMANAGIIDTANNSFIDETTGLEWMDFGINNHYSFDQVQALLTSEYNGWSLATEEQVVDLASNAFSFGSGGIHPSNIDLYSSYQGTNGNYNQIFDAMGYNFTSLDFYPAPLDYYYSHGLFLDSFGGFAALNILNNVDTPQNEFDVVEVRGRLLNGHLSSFDGSISNSQFSTLLVKSTPSEVPEPTTLAIFALGIMGLAARRFKKQ